MTESEQHIFVDFFGEWLSTYPNAPVHEGTGTAYWNALRLYPEAAVRKALVEGSRQSPIYLPTAETVRQLAELETKRMSDRPRNQRVLVGNVDPAYGLPHDHPARLCAEAIERESHELGRRPNDQTTPELALKWSRMIRDATGIDIGALRQGARR